MHTDLACTIMACSSLAAKWIGIVIDIVTDTHRQPTTGYFSMYVCMYVCMYICMYMYVHVCMYIYVFA